MYLGPDENSLGGWPRATLKAAVLKWIRGFYQKGEYHADQGLGGMVKKGSGCISSSNRVIRELIRNQILRPHWTD